MQTYFQVVQLYLILKHIYLIDRCLDASQISPAALASVQKLLEVRGGSFEAATAKRASAACAPLAAWVRANIHYAAALQRVQPLQAHQAKLAK